MSDSPNEPAELPAWFQRPRPACSHQRYLFGEKMQDVLAELRVSTDELARWHTQGFVSFGPEPSRELEPYAIDEIRFVRDVVRSGLSDAQIDRLFAELPRPMNFDPDAVAYSFSLGWVAAVPTENPDPKEVVDEHLDDWLADLDVEANQGRLTELRDQITTLLATFENSDAGEVEEAESA